MRAKRTYNLSPEVVATVRRLVEEEHAAPSQDALVERAVRLYERQLRDQEEASSWQRAALDPAFRAEQERIWREFEGDDRLAFEG